MRQNRTQRPRNPSCLHDSLWKDRNFELCLLRFGQHASARTVGCLCRMCRVAGLWYVLATGGGAGALPNVHRAALCSYIDSCHRRIDGVHG